MRKSIIITFVVLAVLLSLFYFELPLNIIRPVFHKNIINNYARDFKIDPLLITAIIRVESNFAKKAHSSKGAIGLMQLMPATAREMAQELGMSNLSPKDLENPETNIKLGMYYFRKLLDEFNNNQILALAAYNAGLTNVEKWYQQNPLLQIEANDIPFPETRDYVINVQSTYKWLKTVQNFKNLLHPKKA
jgi:soluble lytic murein transglycosylase